MIPIPVGMKYTAAAWGGTLKEVTCAHCATEFVYEIRRLVTTQTSAPLFMGTGSAKLRASTGAEDRLRKTLAKDVDAVLCPGCRRIQPSMSRRIRWKWIKLILCAWVASLIVAFIGHEAGASGLQNPSAWPLVISIASTAVAFVGIILLHFKDFASAAMDRAILKSAMGSDGALRAGLPRPTGDGWLWIRPTLFQPPSICAGCGSPDASKTLQRPFNTGPIAGMKIKVGVCANCHKRARIRRTLCGAAILLLPLIPALFLVSRINSWDGPDLCFGIMAGLTVGGIALAAASISILPRIGSPLRLRKVNLASDEAEIQFTSATAAEVFLAQAIGRLQAQP